MKKYISHSFLKPFIYPMNNEFIVIVKSIIDMVNTEYVLCSERLIHPGGSSGTDTDDNDKILLHQNSSENYNNFLILEQKD